MGRVLRLYREEFGSRSLVAEVLFVPALGLLFVAIAAFGLAVVP